MTNIIERQEWPEADLVITDDGDGILVRQNNTCYRARKWRLNERLIWLVDTAIHCGFKYLRAKNHPKPAYFDGGDRFSKGIHHVSIARRPSEVWVAVVGGWDRPPEMDGVVFNRIFRDFLRDKKIPFNYERGGSKNMKVALEEFPSTLGRITDAVIDDAIRASENRQRVGGIGEAGVVNERQLEVLFEDFMSTKNARYSKFGSHPRYASTWGDRIPDYVIELKSGLRIVVELKNVPMGTTELEQLRGYLAIPEIGTEANGVLIAPAFYENAVAEANLEPRVSLYAFATAGGALKLRLLQGQPALEQAELWP